MLLGSCSGADRSMLSQADAVMEENPDSALSILQGMERDRLSVRDLPYYALLMAQAQVKTNIPIDSDSLISIAYAEYADDWRGDKGIRSSFYMGEVFYNQEKPRDAMRHYLTAYEESKRLGNDYWRAKSAERIADLFFNAYNYPEAARYRKEAIEYFGKANRVANQRYAVADLATDYMNDSRFDEALQLLDSVYAITTKDNPNDSQLLEYLRYPRINILIACDRSNELDSIDNNILDKNLNHSYDIEATILKSRIATNGKDSCAVSLLDSLYNTSVSDEDRIKCLYKLYEHARTDGSHSIALELADSLLYYQNTVAENVIKESALGAERNFYTMMAVNNKRKSQIYLICFLAACIVICSICMIFWIWRRAKNAEFEANIESFMELKAQSDRLVTEKSRLEDVAEKNILYLKDLHEALTEKTMQIKNLEQEITDIRVARSKLELSVEEKGNMTDRLNETLLEKERLIDMLKNDISSLNASIDQQTRNIEVLEGNFKNQSDDLRNKDIVLEALFKEQWATLNMLCDEYYEKGDSPKTRKYIIDGIEKEIKKIGSKKGLAQIEQAVNTHFGGIISQLREECPQLSEKNIHMATLIIAGLSTKATSLLLGTNTSNLYVMKGRLINKISESGIPHKDLFLAKLK